MVTVLFPAACVSLYVGTAILFVVTDVVAEVVCLDTPLVTLALMLYAVLFFNPLNVYVLFVPPFTQLLPPLLLNSYLAIPLVALAVDTTVILFVVLLVAILRLGTLLSNLNKALTT